MRNQLQNRLLPAVPIATVSHRQGIAKLIGSSGRMWELTLSVGL